MTLPATEAPHESLFLPKTDPNGDAGAPSGRGGVTPAAPSAELSSPVESSVAPATPTTLSHTGLSGDSILALILKALYTGELSGRELADKVKIAYTPSWSRSSRRRVFSN